eukprot:m.15432 g.15432  ORF g.15432 m.15432 type:complete len:1457 (-) comp5399_c0_seq1:118-4488(-)
MVSSADGGEEENVSVLVRLRPLNEVEVEAAGRVVAHRTPGEPQLSVGDDKQFTFDEVYSMESTQHEIFEGHIMKMVDSLLEGKNQTVLAYGQTGSGKTFTMGTGFDVDLHPDNEGMVPRAVKYLYDQIDQNINAAENDGIVAPEFSVAVSFLELYRGTFYDLFDTSHGSGKHASNIKILDEKLEDGSINIVISNVVKKKVESAEELMERLRIGSMERVTKSTDMNASSSRSHAIFTMFVTHRRVETETESNSESVVTTTAKFNFVDLAGSERLKRTGATGDRAKEGIDINSGLLALGNVISALGDETKRGSHVPYRASKLTRILQDSLGGNSRTVMIACISPCDRDFIETLNTLKYANRARNIKNKVVVNQDSASRQIQMLHETIAKMQKELNTYRQGGALVPIDGLTADETMIEFDHMRHENQNLKKKNVKLKAENGSLKAQLMQQSLAGLDGSAEVTVQGQSYRVQDLVERFISIQTMYASEKAGKELHALEDVGRGRSITDMQGNSQVDMLRAEHERGRARLAAAMSSGGHPAKAESPNSSSESDIEEDEDDDDDEEEISWEGQQDNGQQKSGNSEAVLESNQVLVDELARQINLQEELLDQLTTKDNELNRQRELYESKLIQMKKEKEKTAEECNRIKSKLSSLSGSTDSEAKQLKKQYRAQIKELESTMKAMADEAKKRDRDMEQQRRAASQIEILKRSLREAREQRRQLIEESKEERRKLRQREVEHNRKLIKLQKQNDKQSVQFRSLEDDVKRKEVQVKKLTSENERLKAEKKKLRQRETSNALELSPDGPATRTRAAKRKQRMTNALSKRKTGVLMRECEEAVKYRTSRQQTEDLVDRRDALGEEKKKLVAEGDYVEAQRIETEMELLSEAIELRQKELVQMDEQGARGCSDLHDLSDDIVDTVSLATKPELQYMLKSFLVRVVLFELEASKYRVKAKQSEILLKEKEILLKSLIAGGKSANDSPMKGGKRQTGKGMSKRSMNEAIDLNKTWRASDLTKKKADLGNAAPVETNTKRKPAGDMTITDEHGVFQGSLRQTEKRQPRKKHESERIVSERPPAKPTSLIHTHTIYGHDDEVISAAVFGNTLLTGSKDKSVRLWDISREDGALALLSDHENKVTKVVHGGAQFFSASRNILRTWDAGSNVCVERIVYKGDGDIRELLSSPDQKLLYIATDKIIRTLDIRNMKETLCEVTHKGKISCILPFGEDSLAVGSMNNVSVYHDFSQIANGQASVELLSPPHYNTVTCLATCGPNLISGSKDLGIKRWDHDQGTDLWSQGKALKQAHDSHVTSLLGLTGDSVFIGGSAKGILRIWDVDELAVKTEGAAHAGSINQIISAGEVVFSASSDRTVKVWRYRPTKPPPFDERRVSSSSSLNETITLSPDISDEIADSDITTTTFPYGGDDASPSASKSALSTRRLTYSLPDQQRERRRTWLQNDDEDIREEVV